MKQWMLICWFCLLFGGELFSQKAIYVSPLGNDSNSGLSTSTPLQSFNAALTLSRKLHVKTILVRSGKYYNTGIKITAADSGLTIRNYKKEKVILYGGVSISKFEKEGKYTTASLPVNILNWEFQMILVNGAIRERSRLPETGWFQHLSTWDIKSKAPLQGGGWSRKPTPDELTQMQYKPTDLERWKDNITNAEISMPHKWDESYLIIQHIDTLKNILHFTYPAITAPGTFNNKQYVVWNTLEGITHPGQWYWNKTTKKIYYWPKENETTDEIIVPTQRNIISLEKGATNIKLEGITLMLAGNKVQNENFACTGVDAAISGNQVSNINIKRLVIESTSANAIRVKGKNISISDVSIKNTGGGGIYYEGNNIKIDNCKIDSVGKIFLSAVGIHGIGKNIHITHCDIEHIPYSGLCIVSDSCCLIDNCIIEHPMDSLQDGGAIYCCSKGTKIFNNYIVGNNKGRFTMGIYFDERSENCIAENNMVINSGRPIHCNVAQNISYRNNIFIDTKKQTINYGGSSNIRINNNLFIAPSIQCSGPSSYDNRVIDDTTKIEAKLRKYANPTGITSFQNNLLFITAKDANTTTNTKLPKTDKIAQQGTQVIQKEKKKLNLRKILNEPLVKQYIDSKHLALTNKQITQIMQTIEQ